MSLNLDAVIETDEDSIDMKSGLDTLQGASDAARCVVETVLTGKIPERQTHKGKVRTILKHSFRGSYGQIFGVEVYDEELKKKFNRIGRAVFAELIAYYFNESMHQDTHELSEKAQGVIEKLGDSSEGIIKQLRVSALKNIHEIATKFNQDVKIRYRKNRDDQTVLAKFDQITAKAFEAIESSEKVDIIAAITRLNINTGNGRLQIETEDETVAFGFSVEYKAVRLEAKKVFSVNLDKNNGIDREKWTYLKLSVSPVELPDGKVIKYIVKGIYGL